VCAGVCVCVCVCVLCVCAQCKKHSGVQVFRHNWMPLLLLIMRLTDSKMVFGLSAD
jgi:hypothetical protein